MIELLDICHFWSFQQSDQLTKFAQLVDQLQNELYVLRHTSSAATPEQRTSLPAEVEESAPKSTEPSAEPKEGRRRRRRREPAIFDSDIDLTSLNYIPLQKLGNLKGRKPLAGRLPTGETFLLGSWRELMLRSCHLVLEHNPNLELPLLDQAGKKVALLDYVPPREGVAFEETSYKGRKIYIYTNYDATHQVLNAMHILTFLPTELKQVEAAAALLDS